ncbi:MAG TPA: penicillin-binding transpeptidase domain-containing protein [Solirubrobacterales bacterium]|nr:penicillin-binding transpeptidase domain-containing protein [Solirubrobacterales bacterium]
MRVSPEAERRRRLTMRTAPVVAIVAFVGGVVVGAGPDAPAATRFLDAWETADYDAMYDELTPEAQEDYPLEQFRRTYERALGTATASELEIGETSEEGDVVTASVELETHVFGTLGGELEVPLSDGLVAWGPELVYPGLAEGERLTRRTRAPHRAPILAADRTPLASGPAAARNVDASALAIVGEVSTPTGRRAAELTARGFPPGSLTGTSGLELAFDERLSGRPGGQLLATSADEESSFDEGRELASVEPVRGKAVRTTIDPAIQNSAVSALGGLYGGVAVLDARKGSVLALAGLGYSAPQPPGSTFKVITATAALDAGVVKPSDEFPVEISNSDIGREIANSHDAPCGGTFVQSFAKSCNTVFAPLGVEVGAQKLVESAELYGFNSPPALFDEASTAALDPPASTLPTVLDSSVAIGETAIGQGEVLATPLQMASVAQTIANEGTRMPTPIAASPDLQPQGAPVEVTSPETAATMRQLMIEVVNSGTGIAAAVPGIQVAGKTGTAELGPAALEAGDELEPGEEPPQELDAWFTAFAPASDPKLAVAVMIVDAEGDGGEIAAPIAQQILASALG